MKNPWPACPDLPRPAAAALAAIHLDDPVPCALTEREWRDALAFADRERFTLVLRDAARHQMPEPALDRVDRDALKNQVRLRGIEQTYRELAALLHDSGLEFVILKGITHTSRVSRVQYDIDLFLPRAHALAARDLLIARGYEPLPDTENLRTDHLPALARKTGWQWRNDFFDPDIPLPVELHFQFWNAHLERFDAPGAEAFWQRRVFRPLAGASLPALHPADALAYACLHVLKHVLTGSVRIYHVYEIAATLHARAADEPFWREWSRLHPVGLQRLQAIVFELARTWFGGDAAPQVHEATGQLPASIHAWFDKFATSPATVNFHPNKDDLWLHLCLLNSRRDAWSVATERLFPRSLPTAAGASFIPSDQLTWRDRLRWRLYWLSHTARRARHHAAALYTTARSALRWYRR